MAMSTVQGKDVKLKMETTTYNSLISRIRCTEFSRLNDHIYLDHAGAALYPECAVKRYHDDLLSNLYGNTHSVGSGSSSKTQEVVDHVRFMILDFLNTTSDNYSVVFTSGCTAALKTVAETFQPDAQKYGDDNVHEFNNNVSELDKADPKLDGASSLVNRTCSRTNASTDTYSSTDNTVFHYLNDNHTSVVGMRSIFHDRGYGAKCHSTKDFQEVLLDMKSTKKTHGLLKLMAFPAQSNFSGTQYPLEWLESFTDGAVSLLDAASFVSTTALDLSHHQPDLVVLSMYKIFGFPTGIGVLLVKNTISHVLQKRYFGGGTVDIALAGEDYHVNKQNISQRFEDGTISFLEIIALKHAMESFLTLTGGISNVSLHTQYLTTFTIKQLASFKHYNSQSAVRIYGNCDVSVARGPIIAFNLLQVDGSFVGYSQIQKLSEASNIHLRTGCFCNVGACLSELQLSHEQVKQNYQSGHVCGDDVDLIEGVPTGCVRISFGFSSIMADVERFLAFITECFIHSQPLKHSGTVQKEVDESWLDKPHWTLTNMYIYPIKSCAAFEVEEWLAGSDGLQYDHQWMIINQSGASITQKRQPRLCKLKPIINKEEETITLTYEDHPDLILPLSPDTEQITHTSLCQSKVCGDKVSVYDYGSEVSDWLEDVFQCSGYRLVKQQNRIHKKSAVGSLANQSSYLMITRESVQSLQQHINRNCSEENVKIELSELVDRFRANLVIRGAGVVFEEENIAEFNTEHLNFKIQGLCERCQMICINQETGERDKQTFQSLMEMRDYNKTKFGVLLQCTNITECVLKVGEKIRRVNPANEE